MIPIETNWGGRAQRYKDMPGASFRTFDPATNTFLQFKTPLHRENWLIQRFRIDVERIEVYIRQVSLGLGGSSKATPSLKVTRRDGKEEIHVVVHYAANLRLVPAVRRLAKSIGAEAVVRDLETIRAEPGYLDDLTYLRQAATVHADLTQGLGAQILSTCNGESIAVADLRTKHAGHEKDVVDGAIARLHMRGQGQIHFNKGERYGSDTRFSAR